MRSNGMEGNTSNSPPFLYVATPPMPSIQPGYVNAFSACCAVPVKQWMTPVNRSSISSSSTSNNSSNAFLT